MQKRLIGILAIVALVALFAGRAWWLYQHRETGDNVLEIGAVLPLTGPISTMGVEIKNALILAEKKINEER